ncbi:MAG: glutathione transferase GstA [Halioglobus sp.]|nr:glutathione transferase GstA [Halioglobus sp.]
MKLYYSPGACSLAPHIALREAGQSFELVKVDLASKKTAGGDDYTRINPKGYVPTLVSDDGEVLTEIAAVLQYIADQNPAAELAPPAGTMARYHLMEWLNFIGTEIHKTLGALFNPAITPEWKAGQLATFGKRSDFLAAQLGDKAYLMGAQFSVADAYLFTVLGWTRLHGVDMSQWPALGRYMERLGERPAVVQAMRAEGLSD